MSESANLAPGREVPVQRAAQLLAQAMEQIQGATGLDPQEMAAAVATAAAAWTIETVDNGTVGAGQMVVASTAVISHYRKVVHELAHAAVAERARH